MSRYAITIFFLVGYLWLNSDSIAQDTVKIVSSDMFYEYEQIRISYDDGWAFKKGNNLEWARKDLNTVNWDTLSPTDINASMVDANGRLEGWFRLRFKLDSSFHDMDMRIIQKVWAATDIYLDGDSIYSFGSTGIDGKPYAEFIPDGVTTYPLPVNDGKEHLLAIHFVDYVGPLFNKLKSEDKTHVFVNLTSSDFTENILKDRLSSAIWTSGLIAVMVILMLLFWLFYFQNSKEYSLLFVAITALIYCLFPLQNLINDTVAMSAGMNIVFEYFGMFSVYGIIISVSVTSTKIINGHVPKLVWVFAGLFFLYFQVFFFADLQDPSIAIFGFIIISAVVCTYYIYSGWKGISGAKWAVVGGLAGTLGLMTLLVIYVTVTLALGYQLSGSILFPILLLIVLSYPLSLLVYVYLWFVQINKDVKSKATEVIKISEEKKELLAKQNILLEEQVEKRTYELNQSLESLKATQSQLIHSEKMASLGELTAGIAHEIQNPLNFVNNFSEVNKELIEDLKAAISKNDQEEVNTLLSDLLENEDKVVHHGKRAEEIVRSMLQHSRGSDGKKELTDINALCDEYMRLSYHGLRAKDQTFNADFELDLDESLPKVEVVPQDIGRVLLNLINNAFQACAEQSERASADSSVSTYQPKVTLITQLYNNSITIRVADNGPGIPEDIRDKIFQPFFTTKPTGQGTGLGLSMSYDIVTKGHGGKLEVESGSESGKGTTFIVQLPLMK